MMNETMVQKQQVEWEHSYF